MTLSEQAIDRVWEVLSEAYGEDILLEKFKSKAQLRFLFSKHPKIAGKWLSKHRKGEVERLPNRIHPKDPTHPKRKVAQKYMNNKSVRNALKTLGTN